MTFFEIAPSAPPAASPGGTSGPRAAEDSTEAALTQTAPRVGSPALDALTSALRDTFDDALHSVVLYGSVLRDGQEFEGLFDLLVVVDGYRAAYRRRIARAATNAMLPPNVFYLEVPLAATRPDEAPGRRVRCKYAVVSLPQLRRRCGRATNEAYFWGRLAQPVGLAWSRDARAATAVTGCLATAVRTFMARAAPLMDGPFDADGLWTRGLAASYRTELRAEGLGRARDLVAADPLRYRQVTAAAAAELSWRVDATSGHYDPGLGGLARCFGRIGWRLRRVQGRILHVLRLIKGTFTFDGGVDYILWKIERHSGVRVAVSERVRRHPLLFGWGTWWKIYRLGGFR